MLGIDGEQVIISWSVGLRESEDIKGQTESK